MSKTRTTPNSAEDKAHEYYTRYGLMTADKAMEVLLERTHCRVLFLKEIFGNRGQNIDLGVVLGEDAVRGLSMFLEDIAIDAFDSYSYQNGYDTEPGKIADAPQGGSHE